ncbi:MAG: hypothetical protein JXQ99_02730 [Hyphomicrobiaceae bacterium]
MINRSGDHSRAFRKINHIKPHIFHDGWLYCSKFDKILRTNDYGASFETVGQLDLQLPHAGIIRMSPLAQRLARAQVYRMRVLPSGNKVYVFRGGIYTQRVGEPTAQLSHAVQRGSRPVSLANRASDLVVFGEYWSNAAREPVHIYGSEDGGLTWKVIYTFEAGAIRHVHGITYDRFDDCFWICTGDYDDECQLIRASRDFTDLQIVKQGGQGFRFFSTIVTEDVLLTATDSATDPNHICLYHKQTGRFERVAEIENTNFYLGLIGRQAFVSTNAEPSEVHDQSASYVWTGSLDEGGWQHLFSFPVDLPYRLSRTRFVPNGLFQYSNVYFPEGDAPDDVLVCYGFGLSGFSDVMACYRSDQWQAQSTSKSEFAGAK